MKRPFQGRSKYRAFTLIELLAVIAIIGILAGLLFPMLGRSMERGRTSQCLAHMRQWAAATHAYLADSQGAFPLEGMGGGGLNIEKEGAWFNALAPYVSTPSLADLCRQFKAPRPGQKSIFMCPSVKIEDLRNEAGAPAAPSNPREAVFAYGYNLWIDHNSRAGEHGGSTAFSPVLRISQILKPSRFAVFGEVAGVGYDNMSGQHQRFRHDGTSTVNIAFADGHAQNFFWTNVFVNTATWPGGQVKRANVGVIWDPEGIPHQTNQIW